MAVGACTSTPTASPADSGAEGAFGCCPDVQSGCTLTRSGLKASDTDDCVVGNDGLIPDPDQEGWTHYVDKNGCGGWSPPPNPKMYRCGVPPQRPEDASTDASDASTDASTDAAGGGDAGDAGSD